MRLAWALGSWSNAHFDHGLYPLGSPRTDRLARYARLFDAAEVDLLFHQHVPQQQMEAWRSQVPDNFVFLPKMHASVTHKARDEAAVDAAGQVLAQYDALRPLLGPCLLQFPKTWAWSEAAAGRLEDLLDLRPPEGLAVELRHPSWWRDDVRRSLRERRATLVWGTYPSAGTPWWSTSDVGYIRLVGTAGKTRGRWIAKQDRTPALLDLRSRVADPPPWRRCYVVVTNWFEGNAIDSLPKAVAALDGPRRAQDFVHPPGRPLIP